MNEMRQKQNNLINNINYKFSTTEEKRTKYVVNEKSRIRP